MQVFIHALKSRWHSQSLLSVWWCHEYVCTTYHRLIYSIAELSESGTKWSSYCTCTVNIAGLIPIHFLVCAANRLTNHAYFVMINVLFYYSKKKKNFDKTQQSGWNQSVPTAWHKHKTQEVTHNWYNQEYHLPANQARQESIKYLSGSQAKFWNCLKFISINFFFMITYVSDVLWAVMASSFNWNVFILVKVDSSVHSRK